MFDSCFHINDNSKNKLAKYSQYLKDNKITKAFIYYDGQKSLCDLKTFKDNSNNFKNLIPVAYITQKKNLLREINHIIKCNFKFIKIHPRWLGVRMSDSKFYIRLFKLLSKTKLTILWCSFDSWEKEANEVNQINLLSKLSNLTKKNIKIIMHGGGTNLLKYYEKFRFTENIFIDLSYTMQHYIQTTLKQDMIFLFKNFDKRILIGSDFPLFSITQFKASSDNLIKHSKISNKKKKNIFINNINQILDYE